MTFMSTLIAIWQCSQQIKEEKVIIYHWLPDIKFKSVKWDLIISPRNLKSQEYNEIE